MTNQIQTEAWLLERAGYVSASRLIDVMSGSERYMRRLADERDGAAPQTFRSYSTERGKEMERVAITAYELINKVSVDLAGFIKSKTIKWFGATPDGLVGKDGGLETKCLYDEKLLKKIKQGKIPVSFILQCAGNLIATGRKWWDLVIFCPQLDASEAYYVRRITRADFNEQHIIDKIKNFNEEVEKARE